jgi:hypothetical protein
MVDADYDFSDSLSPSFQASLDTADEQVEAASAYSEAFAFR